MKLGTLRAGFGAFRAGLFGALGYSLVSDLANFYDGMGTINNSVLPLEVKTAANVLYASVGALTVPVAAFAADGVVDMFKGTAFYLCLNGWKKMTKDTNKINEIEGELEQMIAERNINVGIESKRHFQARGN